MLLKFGVSSLTYRKLLTNFDIKVLFISQDKIGVAGNLLNTLENFLEDRKEKVALNGQNSPWVNVEAGVPKGSILQPLLFLIYINHISENLVSNPKLFLDGLSPFSVIFHRNLSEKNLNDNLNRINN